MAKIACGIYFGEIFWVRYKVFDLVIVKKQLNFIEKMLRSIYVHHGTYEYVPCFDGINFMLCTKFGSSPYILFMQIPL